MVLRLLSSCGVLESTILDLDPLACGDLGVGTHTNGGILEPILMGSLTHSYGVPGVLESLNLEPT